MTAPRMSVDDFQDILDRHGDDSDGWPADRRSAAEALLSVSPVARERLAQAKALRLLLQDDAPKAPDGLAERIVDAALGKSPPK